MSERFQFVRWHAFVSNTMIRNFRPRRHWFRKLVAEALEPRVVFDASPLVIATSPDYVWSNIDSIPSVPGKQSYLQPSAFTVTTLSKSELSSRLIRAPQEFSEQAKTSAIELTLPTPTNGFARFKVVSSPIMEPALAAQFPEIQTYSGQGIDDPAATVRFDVTPAGFHAQVLSPSGAYYIDPYYHLDDSVYVSYYKRDLVPRDDMRFIEEEHAEDDHTSKELDSASVTSPGSAKGDALPKLEMDAEKVAGGVSDGWGLAKDPNPVLSRAGAQLRTYRLANAATGEYTAFHGGTVALGQAAIVTAVNRVTGIYENELSVRLVLVANNSLLVYTNAATDPYTNSDPFALLNENQANIDALIGNANYDIGHVFSTGGGGLAGLG